MAFLLVSAEHDSSFFSGIASSHPSVCLCDSSIVHYCIAGNIRGVQILFFSFSEQKFNTRNVCYDRRDFLCKMDGMEIKHMNQLEIAQNKIWTPRKFSAIWYSDTPTALSNSVFGEVH